jgi:hypothetical protein
MANFLNFSYGAGMKFKLFIVLFPFFVFFYNCQNYEDIIRRHYQYERSLSEKIMIYFNIQLDNVSYSKRTANLIEKLVYQGKNFNEYISYTEEKLKEVINSSNFLSLAGVSAEDRNNNHLYYCEKINILHNFDSFLVIEHKKYLIFSSVPRGILWAEYLIIDLAGERILDVNEIAVPLSEDFLKDVIKENYNVNNFLRDEIWPPDSINISQDSVELTWNVNSIAPLSDGLISVVLQNDLFLTKKGKAIKAKICSNDSNYVSMIFDGKRLNIRL